MTAKPNSSNEFAVGFKRIFKKAWLMKMNNLQRPKNEFICGKCWWTEWQAHWGCSQMTRILLHKGISSTTLMAKSCLLHAYIPGLSWLVVIVHNCSTVVLFCLETVHWGGLWICSQGGKWIGKARVGAAHMKFNFDEGKATSNPVKNVVSGLLHLVATKSILFHDKKTNWTTQ